MKTLNLFLILLLTGGSIVMAQSPSTIPWKNSNTRTRPTTTQPAAPQPMQVTPKASTGMVIGSTINVFSNPSNVLTLADGTRLTVSLRANQTNLPQTLGGVVSEREVARTAINNDPSQKCESVTKIFTATSDNFLNSEYSATSSTIFPGAIYTATNFLTGNRKVIEYGRNPVEIGVDNVLNTTGSTYRTVNQPTQNEINSAIASIAGTMNGSGEDIKYRVYISESDAEQVLNAAASGSFAGFSVSAEYRNRSREHVRIMTIDATKSYFTTSVNMPAAGYFADKSIEQTNKDLIVLKNVVYGCRVLANIVIRTSGRQDEVNFLASYSGVGTDAKGVFDYLKTHNNFESTANAMVIGGPAGTTTFSAARLEQEISDLMARANYRNARPIAYTLTDIYGNVLGIQSATDQITVPVCTPKAAVYTLKSARIEIATGNNDPKNDGSTAIFSLSNANNVEVAADNSPNNIEFPTGSSKTLNLPLRTTDAAYTAIMNFSNARADIFFTPVGIGLGWDEWQIRSVVLYLEFVDQSGAPHPANQFPVRYDNLNVYMKKDRQRLVLPFSFNGANFVAGGPNQPTGTATGIGGMMKSVTGN